VKGMLAVSPLAVVKEMEGRAWVQGTIDSFTGNRTDRGKWRVTLEADTEEEDTVKVTNGLV
jgi:hypothetical protein